MPTFAHGEQGGSWKPESYIAGQSEGLYLNPGLPEYAVGVPSSQQGLVAGNKDKADFPLE